MYLNMLRGQNLEGNTYERILYVTMNSSTNRIS